MTVETLKFLRDLIAHQQISADNPDIVAVASLIARVRTELDEAIATAERPAA